MYNNKISEEQAKKEFEKGCKEAEELLKKPDELEKFLQRLESKLKVIPMLGDTFSIVPLMISLVRSYIKKEYTKVPLGTIVGIISALIYILSPFDVISDIIGPAGYMDDAAVLIMCLKAGIEDDIKEYQRWREKNNKVIEED